MKTKKFRYERYPYIHRYARSASIMRPALSIIRFPVYFISSSTVHHKFTSNWSATSHLEATRSVLSISIRYIFYSLFIFCQLLHFGLQFINRICWNLQGYIAVADHALSDSTGRHFACFLVPLDRSAIPNISALRDALSSVTSEVIDLYFCLLLNKQMKFC